MRTITVLMLVLLCGCERSAPPPAPAATATESPEKIGRDAAEAFRQKLIEQNQPFEECYVFHIYPANNGTAYIETDSGLWFASGRTVYRLSEDMDDPKTKIHAEYFHKLIQKER